MGIRKIGIGVVISLLFCLSISAQQQTPNKEGAKTILLNPVDKRPITNEYVKIQGELIGSEVKVTSSIYADNYVDENTYIPGNAKAIRDEMDQLVKKYNSLDTTVILNTCSYLNGGVTASRMPNTYKDMEEVLQRIEALVKENTLSNFYINVNIPRTKPDIRGFNWGQASWVDGYEKIVLNQDKQTRFDEAIFQYTYLLIKEEYENLTEAEYAFINGFYNQYVENCPEILKYEGVPLALVYTQMFKDAEYFINSLIQMAQNYPQVEVVICVDDCSVPSIIQRIKPKEKYSLSSEIIKRIKASQALEQKNISLVYGYDDVTQSIVARDYTKRTGKKTEYVLHYIQGEATKSHVGAYDAAPVETIITAGMQFLNEYGTHTDKTYHVFIHNSDIKENLLTEAEAEVIAKEIAHTPCAMVLDLRTNKADEELMRGLKKYHFPIRVYSGWNTVGNAINLGLAHAQVQNKNEKGYDQLFVQHIYEDWVYNNYFKRIEDTQTLAKYYETIDLGLGYTTSAVTRPYNRNFEITLALKKSS